MLSNALGTPTRGVFTVDEAGTGSDEDTLRQAH